MNLENLGIMLLFILVVIAGILVIWTMLDIFSSKMKTTHKLLWFIAVLIAPVLGSLAYLNFGRKKDK